MFSSCSNPTRHVLLWQCWFYKHGNSGTESFVHDRPWQAMQQNWPLPSNPGFRHCSLADRRHVSQGPPPPTLLTIVQERRAVSLVWKVHNSYSIVFKVCSHPWSHLPQCNLMDSTKVWLSLFQKKGIGPWGRLRQSDKLVWSLSAWAMTQCLVHHTRFYPPSVSLWWGWDLGEVVFIFIQI